MNTKRISLVKVKQWLNYWDPIAENKDLGNPPKFFYIASMSLSELRLLAGVNKRTLAVRKKTSKNAGFQRELNTERTKVIARYIQYGFPLSTDAKLSVEDNKDLIHPGWLPTPILINLLDKGDWRWKNGERKSISDEYLIKVESNEGGDYLYIPKACFENGDTNELRPIEIIDGQHRVFAIDSFDSFPDDYHVPVVIFCGLSQSWQAYLFWVINVEPKRINTSLAFDLYPELRTKEWLERGTTNKIYRDHRAQELTDVMWKYSESPWRDRIELFGNRISGHVSNAAFIRSLANSFLKGSRGKNNCGGLFSAIKFEDDWITLPWKRSQQAAFLIFCWKQLSIAARNKNKEISNILDEEFNRLEEDKKKEINPHNEPSLIASPSTLLATDQGIQTIHYIFNLYCIKSKAEIELCSWEVDSIGDDPDEDSIAIALQSLTELEKLSSFIKSLADSLIECFDWRSSSATGLSFDEKKSKLGYRGSSGYALLKREVINSLKNSEIDAIRDISIEISKDESEDEAREEQ